MSHFSKQFSKGSFSSTICFNDPPGNCSTSTKEAISGFADAFHHLVDVLVDYVSSKSSTSANKLPQ